MGKMNEKRFTLSIDTEWWFVGDNTIKVNEFGYREDLGIDGLARGIKQELTEQEVVDLLNQLAEENEQLKSEYKVLHTQYQDLKKFVENNFDEHLTQEKLNRQIIKLSDENKQLKSQLYCDDEEGICNICKHHYLVSDDEAELGYYNSRCKKGHYECARISLTHCEDFELICDME